MIVLFIASPRHVAQRRLTLMGKDRRRDT
ncbi:hypothetical protein M3J09_003820 [Ascochyta lentis]